MGVNNYRPRVLILPEDDANRQVANGFLTFTPNLNVRCAQLLPSAGGWGRVRDSFTREHNAKMQRYPNRLMLLLVDFDQDPQRITQVRAEVDPSVRDRVFVLGALVEPEDIRKALGVSLEAVGRRLGAGCPDAVSADWQHAMLQHNQAERDRFVAQAAFMFT